MSILYFLFIFFLIFDNVIAGLSFMISLIYVCISTVIILSFCLFIFLSTLLFSKYFSIHRCNEDLLQSNIYATLRILLYFKYNFTADNLKSVE